MRVGIAVIAFAGAMRTTKALHHRPPLRRPVDAYEGFALRNGLPKPLDERCGPRTLGRTARADSPCFPRRSWRREPAA